MTGRNEKETDGITLLGNQGTKYPDDYAPELLETFINKHPDNDYFVKFNCPEFTSLCPITGQPDFAAITISYVPDIRMVESKSLKLYLFSFRNHGDFHEDCVNIIMKDLIRLMDPKYIEVWGKFTPRGGISIDPYFRNIFRRRSVRSQPVLSGQSEISGCRSPAHHAAHLFSLPAKIKIPAKGTISAYTFPVSSSKIYNYLHAGSLPYLKDNIL